ncbi:hypothetical protein CO058_02680 [candidate division WWE3 bacterium CG_4_9_14_0_2_um_filter_35_11]|uniref:NAD-dependent epimerase/dehydratase domain-containing protein n=1 Tax=candidate division WWE3 bacterium CG_4_9_14_0_2_um_filter_35_11 TaxID=1975077 RepID=A0A2M8ELP6_UNCKA|nr:MAG: hypothetical protein COV25_02940 [candidate division WWE3 bacterium CG10_big_fil_rev_8_21_14_0_10_35_32]PJC23640.1 MAG: hypothetical protein CO058_02680 [candidate division WWE3 bacterium CG_4_9_14_0_2_um_filter_35_11]
MKVLVTGAAGFIGSYVSRALLWRGDDVCGIDNFSSYYPRNCKEFNVDLVNLASGRKTQFFPYKTVSPVYKKIEGYFSGKKSDKPGHFSFYEIDITNFDALQDLFIKEEFDAVVHLAAWAGVPVSTKNPRLYTTVNVDGTVNLLNLSKEHGVKKFLFGSSSSVYGDRNDKKVEETDDVTKAVSIYGATKVAGEVLCHSANAIFGLNCVVIRIFGPIYGPLQRPKGMFMQRALNFVHNKKTMNIYGKNGLNTAKDSTYIDDEVDGIILALDSDFNFEVYNIGTSDPQSIQQWLDAIGKHYGTDVMLEIGDKDVADVVSSADISKAKKRLGYKPKMKLNETVRRQVEVFKLMPEWYQTMSDV